MTCIQISQEAGQVVWYSHLFQNFSQYVVIHTVKGFGTISKAEINVFLELSCFFDDPTDVGNLISVLSAFSKTSLNILKFTVHIQVFEAWLGEYWALPCYCVRWLQLCKIWAFFNIAFLWDWNENWTYPFLWPLLHLPNLLAYWEQHFHSIIF